MDPAFTSLLTIAGSGIAAYYGAYFKKRGEDEAIKENFAQVLSQTAETTKTTKGIETKLTSDVWDYQKRWELKRDVILAMVRTIAEAQDALHGFHSTLFVDGEETKSEVTQRRWRRWMKSTTKLEESKILTEVVCNQKIRDALAQFMCVAYQIASGIDKKDRELYETLKTDLHNRASSVNDAARQELSIDQVKSQSNESSATPSPAPRAPATK
jgi:uncharacterized membrane-anchored protein YjiN (DUF445 family)